MQTYYIINPRRGAEISFTKFLCWSIKCPSRTNNVFKISASGDVYFMAYELTTIAKWAVNNLKGVIPVTLGENEMESEMYKWMPL
jgi:hypothetical protein